MTQDEQGTMRGEVVGLRTFARMWSIVTLRVAGRGEVKATGTLVADVGDTVELAGQWQEGKYGREFKFTRGVVLTPEGSVGTIKWLASKLPNLGEARARALVERFGVTLWDVISSDPLAMVEVNGITEARARAIAEAYDLHKAERDNLITLRDWTLTENQIGRCVEHFGGLPETIEALRENPYRMCEVGGVGFLRADQIASAMGLDRASPARIAEGVRHVLREARGEGHAYLAGGTLQRMACDLLRADRPLVAREMKRARDEGSIVVEGERFDRCYLPELHDAESRIAAGVAALLEAGEFAA